ncbi:hypothetical protein WDZ16_10810 [Pseudokineococcus marinus]|uniref:hypothetical protein n=1 Tax=Pseudokineococcus marinus TaxID=351215 RepID=UPI001489FE81|nr:hypothetical protein [Pseudokineococcus marinus]
MRARGWAVVPLMTVLLLPACSGQETAPAVVVPSGPAPSSDSSPSSQPSSPGPTDGAGATSAPGAAQGGPAAGDGGAPPVEVRSTDLAADEAAVVAGFAAFLGDWSAVVAQPDRPELQDSAHATPDGDAALARAAGVLAERGSRIEGDLVLVDPVVRVQVPVGAEVSACLDQSDLESVADDGTVLDSDEPDRVTASAALVPSGRSWSVADFVVEGEPC